jgi:hypothetical protein
MSELEKQIANRVANNADMEGAQDLIDAHIDAVTGGLIVVHWNYFEVVTGPYPPDPGGPIYTKQ